MAILRFNGHDVPEPSDIQFGMMDISTSDSGRGQSGYMNKYLVATKRQINVSWNNISRSDAREVISYLKENGVYVTVVYDGDLESSGTKTGEFYYGDISAAFQQVWVGNRKRYSKLSFTLIER